MPDVSPVPGHGPLAAPRVRTAPAHFPTSSIPRITSQFRGPFVYNETDEERAKREEDEKKRTNFDKVRQKAEDEEKARKTAEARVKELEEEKRQREEADRKAAEKKLEEDGNLKALADAKAKEAEEKAAEAAREKARADAAEAKAKEYETAQEAELAELLKQFPDGKAPPLDASDPVSKRLSHAKYALSLIQTEQPKPVGHPMHKKGDQSNKDRMQELLRKPRRTPEESAELAKLSGEQ